MGGPKAEALEFQKLVITTKRQNSGFQFEDAILPNFRLNYSMNKV